MGFRWKKKIPKCHQRVTALRAHILQGLESNMFLFLTMSFQGYSHFLFLYLWWNTIWESMWQHLKKHHKWVSRCSPQFIAISKVDSARCVENVSPHWLLPRRKHLSLENLGDLVALLSTVCINIWRCVLTSLIKCKEFTAGFKRACNDAACVLSDERNNTHNLTSSIVEDSHKPRVPLHLGCFWLQFFFSLHVFLTCFFPKLI